MVDEESRAYLHSDVMQSRDYRNPRSQVSQMIRL